MSVLQYNVSKLVREPVGSTREHGVDEDVLVDGDRRHIAGRTRMMRTGRGVLVYADLNGIEPDSCSRCLRDIDVPLHLHFEEEFFSTVDAETGAKLPPPEDADAFRIDAQQLLDLDEAVRQWWAATLPLQALCRPGCEGLCPRCGKDLNEGACACPPEQDERWDALRALAGKLEGN